MADRPPPDSNEAGREEFASPRTAPSDGVAALLVRFPLSGPADVSLLRAACREAIRERRVDLLLPHVDLITALPGGVERECALAVIALASGNLHDADRRVQGLPVAPYLDAGDAEVIALTMSEVGLASAALGRWTTALDAVQRGRALLVDTATSGATRRCELDFAGLAALAECHMLSGDTELLALQSLIAPIRMRNALTADHALALVCLGSVQSTRGRWGEAALDLRRGIALTPPSRGGIAAHAAIELCLVRVRQGRWDDAEEEARHLTGTIDGVDSAWLRPQILAVGSLLAAIRGDDEAASPALEQAVLLGRDYPTVLLTTVLLHARICAAIARNDWTRLRRVLDDAEDLTFRRPYDPAEWAALRLLAAWHLRNTVEFRRRLTQWGLRRDAENSALYWAFCTILAESEGRHSDGVTAIAAALERLDDDLDPLGRAWVRIVAGTYLSRHGADGDPDPVNGLTVYEEAHRELVSLGAAGYANICRNIMAKTTAELSRAREVEPAIVLTEQQLRVARLVSAGYTSGEIGDILHLSRKTVDFHVGNIVRRLGLGHRREITRVLRP